MKKLYMSILFISFFSVSMKAQLTLTKTANEPVIGDITMMASYDSVSVIPKNTGAGQNWNFMSLFAGTFTETTTYTTVASTPSASTFSAATMAAVRGTSNYEYWRTSTSMLEYVGNQDPSGPETLVFSNYGTWINWPTAFGNSNTDSFIATQTSGTNTSNWNGTVSYTATGSGTVTLPNGNIHTNCLQIKRVISISATSGTNTSQINITGYDYFSSANKFPILSVDYQSQTTGTVVSKNYSVYSNTSAMQVGLNETSVNNNFVVYPNPASDQVNVILANNEIPSAIELIDMLGRTVASSDNSNSVNTNMLSKGIYSVRVKTKNGLGQRSLVISE